MDVSQSVDVFRSQFEPDEREQLLRALFAAVVSFYLDCSAEGLVEEFGDGLLFQYGVYGSHFEIDLTRQFIEASRNDGYDVMSQFHLTCFYKPTDDLISLGADSKWCWSRAEIPAFFEWILAHPALVAVESTPPVRTEMGWELV